MVLIIPDLHGRLDVLEQVLAAYPDHQYVILGDLIDRGPDSAGVVKRVRELVDAGRARLCAGNHEVMMLRAFESAIREDGEDTDEMALWLFNGGLETLRSYDADPEALNDDLAWLAENAEQWVLLEEYGVLCSHAMRPNPQIVSAWENGGDDALTEEYKDELRDSLHLWGRPGDELYPLPEGIILSVHGHTPQVKRDGEGYVSKGVRSQVDAYGTGVHFIDLGAVFGTERFAVMELLQLAHEPYQIHELTVPA